MSEQKKKTLINFKKASTHLEKIKKMVEQDEYCINIMQQNLAVIGLLKSAHQMLLENHLRSCFKTGMDSGSKKLKNDMIEEILKITKLASK